jgi:hypothetical protein
LLGVAYFVEANKRISKRRQPLSAALLDRAEPVIPIFGEGQFITSESVLDSQRDGILRGFEEIQALIIFTFHIGVNDNGIRLIPEKDPETGLVFLLPDANRNNCARIIGGLAWLACAHGFIRHFAIDHVQQCVDIICQFGIMVHHGMDRRPLECIRIFVTIERDLE